MLKFVLWLAAGCVVLLVALALLPDRAGEAPKAREEMVVVAREPARPVVPPPAPKVEPEAPPVAPIDPVEAQDQIADDAAAVGMTTLEPAASEDAPAP